MMVACSCGVADLLGSDAAGHGLTACRGQYRMRVWAVAELVELEDEIQPDRAEFEPDRAADQIGRDSDHARPLGFTRPGGSQTLNRVGVAPRGAGAEGVTWHATR